MHRALQGGVGRDWDDAPLIQVLIIFPPEIQNELCLKVVKYYLTLKEWGENLENSNAVKFSVLYSL